MKIDRLISIIMVLLEREKISSSKLAEMFEVTTRTIFRDIETINMAGIPIITYPGVHGGIGIMDKYKIEKRLFTISDITALLTGLGSIHATMSSTEVLNAMAKVKGLIPEEQVKEIELRSSQVIIDHMPWFGNKNLKLNLKEIKIALDESRFLSFEYSDRDGNKTQRKIEPYRLVLKDSNWYLQGYCSSKQDFRIFRLSRISLLKLHKETYVPREFDAQPLSSTEKKTIPVKLLIDQSLQDLMLELCGEENMESCGDHKWTVQFPFVEDDFGYNMLLRLGDKCECLEPEHVRSELIRRIKDLLGVYEKA